MKRRKTRIFLDGDGNETQNSMIGLYQYLAEHDLNIDMIKEFYKGKNTKSRDADLIQVT